MMGEAQGPATAGWDVLGRIPDRRMRPAPAGFELSAVRRMLALVLAAVLAGRESWLREAAAAAQNQ